MTRNAKKSVFCPDLILKWKHLELLIRELNTTFRYDICCCQIHIFPQGLCKNYKIIQLKDYIPIHITPESKDPQQFQS
jgi:hypothetical protein